MTEEKLKFPFDPLKRSEEVESMVMRGEKRLYHRFRPAPYYGGIATADAVGCSFLCAYCWNYFRNLNPQRFDDFYSPQQVASKLIHIARKKDFRLLRISGAEPILGEKSFEHLRTVLHRIFQSMPHGAFILETNGFILGTRNDLVEKLRFPNLNIRVSLKGTDEDTFERITGAKKEFFQYPLIALQKLGEAGIRAWPALMKDLFIPEEVDRLEKLLSHYGRANKLELEALEAYPFVLENMKRRNIQLKNL